jgi:hypothetical protein
MLMYEYYAIPKKYWPEAPKGPRVINFQEWRDTSSLTYLKSIFTKGLKKDLHTCIIGDTCYQR